MDSLLESIQKSSLIGSDSDIISKRKTQYKSRAEVSAREKQIKELVEHWKSARAKLVSEKRGLLSDDYNEDEEWMDWQEIKKSQNKGRKWVNPHCKNQLMLSMWLTETPSDLEANWSAVVCPEGRRTLVIAKRGCTRAYHKSGFLLAKFKSILPNGAPTNRTKNSDLIILDCIWNESSLRLFALDVLFWKHQTLLDCDAQFRLYWLKTKLSEVKQSFSEECLEPDVYNVFLPSHCNPSSLPQTLEEHPSEEVDGILFYHNSAPYISGQTPLVGWLKPFMVPEKLGLPVPQSYMDLRPADYSNLTDWVARFSHTHDRKSRLKNTDELEIDSSTQDSDNTSIEMEENAEDQNS